MNKPTIIPYNDKSQSAKALADALGLKVLSRKLLVVGNVINWGCTSLLSEGMVLNSPNSVANAVDKLKCFKILNENNIPTIEYTNDINVVQSWLDEGNLVFARKNKLFRGRGIKLIKNPAEIVNADFYTKYIPERREYRLHCTNQSVFDFSRKAKRKNQQYNEFIRNHRNGWIFKRKYVKLPPGLEELAIKAVQALDLDFCAVDIIFDKDRGTMHVLEVNTAPGLVNTTLENYVNMFKNHPFMRD